MEIKKQENIYHSNALDGYRAFAITLIVASHCQFIRQRGVGNCIFFSLSGFLAAIKLIDNESFFFSIKNIFIYYIKRILRIMPVFWFIYLIHIYFHPEGRNIYNVLNVLFLTKMSILTAQKSAHLWFLQNLMLLYFLTPFIILFVAFTKKLIIKNNFFIFLFLVISAFLANNYLVDLIIQIIAIRLRLGLFLLGMATAYLAKSVQETKLSDTNKKLFFYSCNVFVIVFLSACILSSPQILPYFDPSLKSIRVGWDYPMICASLASLCAFSLYIFPSDFINKLLGNRFCILLAKISFCTYILHWYLIPYFNRITPCYNKFIIVELVTISLSYFIYLIVEKPSIIFAKNFSIKEVIKYFKSIAFFS